MIHTDNFNDDTITMKFLKKIETYLNRNDGTCFYTLFDEFATNYGILQMKSTHYSIGRYFYVLCIEVQSTAYMLISKVMKPNI